MALDTNLIAHYRLDNDSNDSAGSYNGTDTDITYSGTMADFNGATSEIATTLFLNTANDYTFNVWFKLGTSEGGGGYDFMGCLNESFNNMAMFGVYNGKYHLGFSNIEKYTTTHSLAIDTMYMATVVCSGTTATMYIDGVSVDSITYASGSSVPVPIHLGAVNIENYGNGNYLDGELANFRIYSDAKDQTFIDELLEEGPFVYPAATATVSVTATAQPVLYTAAATAFVSVTGSAAARAKINASAAGDVTVTGAATSYGTVSDTSMFSFVYAIQRTQAHTIFKFVYRIEQPKNATTIKRINI